MEGSTGSPWGSSGQGVGHVTGLPRVPCVPRCGQVQQRHPADDGLQAGPLLETVLEVCQPRLPPGVYGVAMGAGSGLGTQASLLLREEVPGRRAPNPGHACGCSQPGGFHVAGSQGAGSPGGCACHPSAGSTVAFSLLLCPCCHHLLLALFLLLHLLFSFPAFLLCCAFCAPCARPRPSPPGLPLLPAGLSPSWSLLPPSFLCPRSLWWW